MIIVARLLRTIAFLGSTGRWPVVRGSLPRTIGNIEDAKQFIRASGSIGANYIEANEAIGRKDFVMKIKICRREAKETCYWLRLLDVDGNLERQRQQLSAEAKELMNIFGAILRKCE